MDAANQIEGVIERLRGLGPPVNQRMCESFADLFWDYVDIFKLIPGVLLETETRVFVVQEINGELRYYAGGWGTECSRVTELNELGVFEHPADVLPFAEQFLIKSLSLRQINSARVVKGGTALGS